MGLYGAIIVLPSTTAAANGCNAGSQRGRALCGCGQHWREADFPSGRVRLRPPEDLLRPRIPVPVLRDGSEYPRAGAGAGHGAPRLRRLVRPNCSLEVPTEPYHPAYFMINGRSMPDDMDPNYAAQYPHQPYNGNPHMHPGELVLLRIIGQGRWQHPFHEHGNHVRILGRDGNLILSLERCERGQPGRSAAVHHHDHAGPRDGRHLLLDRQGSELGCVRPQSGLKRPQRPRFMRHALPDANGYNTGRQPRSTTTSGARITTSRCRLPRSATWPAAARATLPDPNLFTNGAWYGGSPYLGPDATTRATGPTGTTPPPARSRIRRPARRVSHSCGTRITSARSPPTIFSPAAC